MTQTKEKLLEIRKKMSAKRPKFLRQDYHHRMKVQDDYWRAPKGRHSKMRGRKRSHRAKVLIGYRGPAEVRGLYKTGAVFVRIENLQQLAAVNPKTSVVILSSTVGAKKKYQLLKTASEKGIFVVNVNAKKFIENFDAKLKTKTTKSETPNLSKAQMGPAKQEVSLGKPKEIPPQKVVTKKSQEDKFGA